MALAIPAIVAVGVRAEDSHGFGKIRTVDVVIEFRPRLAQRHSIAIEAKQRAHLVEVASRDHGEIGQASVLPPETIAPASPVGVQVWASAEFGVHREDRPIELDRIIAAASASGNPSLKDVRPGDATAAYLLQQFAIEEHLDGAGCCIDNKGDMLPLACLQTIRLSHAVIADDQTQREAGMRIEQKTVFLAGGEFVENAPRLFLGRFDPCRHGEAFLQRNVGRCDGRRIARLGCSQLGDIFRAQGVIVGQRVGDLAGKAAAAVRVNAKPQRVFARNRQHGRNTVSENPASTPKGIPPRGGALRGNRCVGFSRNVGHLVLPFGHSFWLRRVRGNRHGELRHRRGQFQAVCTLFDEPLAEHPPAKRAIQQGIMYRIRQRLDPLMFERQRHDRILVAMMPKHGVLHRIGHHIRAFPNLNRGRSVEHRPT